jgi:hypothetical protein
MGYGLEQWNARLAERSDMATRLTHLTREAEFGVPLDVHSVLYKILRERTLYGSTTQTGFICGDTRAVCFQDAPLASICQNVYFEQKYARLNPTTKTRYRPLGLMFTKPYVFSAGGRPVFYERTDVAKRILPRDQWWRIVNLDLESHDRIVDWTHEREWRLPGDFRFELSEATVLLANKHSYDYFIKICELTGEGFHRQVAGIVVLDAILR